MYICIIKINIKLIIIFIRQKYYYTKNIAKDIYKILSFVKKWAKFKKIHEENNKLIIIY